MRKLSNFRLSENTIHILNELALSMGVSKTHVLEEALVSLAKKRKIGANQKPDHPILKYVGMWKDVDVDQIIHDIYSSRTKSRRKPPTW